MSRLATRHAQFLPYFSSFLLLTSYYHFVLFQKDLQHVGLQADFIPLP